MTVLTVSLFAVDLVQNRISNGEQLSELGDLPLSLRRMGFDDDGAYPDFDRKSSSPSTSAAVRGRLDAFRRRERVVKVAVKAKDRRDPLRRDEGGGELAFEGAHRSSRPFLSLLEKRSLLFGQSLRQSALFERRPLLKGDLLAFQRRLLVDGFRKKSDRESLHPLRDVRDIVQ